MRSSVSCCWITVVVLSSRIGSSWTFCATNLILFGIFQCLRWHDEEQEGKDFTNFLTQISSQCVLQLSGEKNGIPSRPHPSKWQQLPRNQISVTWFFLKMKRDCFYLSSWLGNYTPFFLFVTSCWHSVQSFLDCLQGFMGPSGLLHHHGSISLATYSPDGAGWLGTRTCSGVILLVWTCICVSVHHSKVKCTWFRITLL